MISMEEFLNIKEKDVFYAQVGSEIIKCVATSDTHYNPDADEPDYEVESNNGIFDRDSIIEVFPQDKDEKITLKQVAQLLTSHSYLNDYHVDSFGARNDGFFSVHLSLGKEKKDILIPMYSNKIEERN